MIRNIVYNLDELTQVIGNLKRYEAKIAECRQRAALLKIETSQGAAAESLNDLNDKISQNLNCRTEIMWAMIQYLTYLKDSVIENEAALASEIENA